MSYELKRFRSDQESKSLDDEGTGSAHIATLNVIDHDGDVILPGAFLRDGNPQTVAVVPAHDANVVPLGKATVRELGDAAVADFKLNLETQSGREWASHLKFDMAEGVPVQEWSFRFEPTVESRGQHEGRSVRFLKQMLLAEVSPVLVGAGIGTHTVAVKEKSDSYDGDMIKEYCGISAENLTFDQAVAGVNRLNQASVKSEVFFQHRSKIYNLLQEVASANAWGQPLPSLHTDEEIEMELDALRKGSSQLLRHELRRVHSINNLSR